MQSLSTYTADLTIQQRSLGFMHWLSAFHASLGNPLAATERYQQRFPGHHVDVVTKALDLYTKAAVGPGTSTDATWASPLVGVKPFTDAFIGLARSESLIGRIPRLRTAPFGVKVPIETGGANYTWVGQNTPKPISKFSFTNGVQLTATKAVGIIVETAELMRLAVPGAAERLRDDLVDGLVAFTDRQFLDPAVAAVADTNPASITNGTTAVTGTGDVVTDVGALVDAFYADRPGAQAVLIMGEGTEWALRRGEGRGEPVTPIVTSGVAGELGIVVMLDPRGVLVADGGVDIDVSREAALEMVDNPAAPTASTVFVTLFQQNLAGLRVERVINWTTAPNAVKYLTLA